MIPRTLDMYKIDRIPNEPVRELSKTKRIVNRSQ